MKIHKQIVGRNKIRDLLICDFFASGLSATEIMQEMERRNKPMTLRRCHQILSTNKSFLNDNVVWPKYKRVQRLQRIADKTSDKISKRKDILDVMEQLRKEIEGDKSNQVIDQSQTFNLQINFHQEAQISDEEKQKAIERFGKKLKKD